MVVHSPLTLAAVMFSGVDFPSQTNEETPLLIDPEINHERSDLMKTESSSTTSYESKVKLPLLYIFFRIHNTICVLSLALVIVAQALPPPHHRLIFVTALVHFYALCASTIGIIIELDISEWFMQHVVPILERWFVRGLFYVFLGLFAMEESFFSDDGTDALHSFGSRLSSSFLWISSLGLLFSGSLYLIMGAFFMQALKKRSEEEYERRLKETLNINENNDSDQ
jgi:hypothetical protein